MTNTDPAAFNSETTGMFKVQPLSADVMDVRVEQVPLTERLEERAARVEAQAHVDEYGHRTDCQGCSAPTCGPPVQDTAYGYLPPRETITPILRQLPVSLTYAHSDGETFTRVDTDNSLTHPGDLTDHDHRERLLLRALLEHTLAMLKGEDVS